MGELDADDVENIKEGTYVYWMDQSEDVPRGTLGVVIDVDGDERRVKFPNDKITVAATKLNASDFQKDTLVHFTKDGIADDQIGEVTDLEDGKLQINFQGETKSEKPKYLIKCDFQAGMFVHWSKADDDIPSGHVGEVLQDLNEKGKIKVKFPAGSWRFRPRDLVRCNVQPGSYVQWTSSDEDIKDGELGKVTGEINDKGRVKVAFSKDTWGFKPESLVLYEVQLGAFVKWQKIDEDVKKGDLGQVVGIKVSQGKLRVQFPAGRWKFRPSELSLSRIQPGKLVTWRQTDEDIARGDLGEVIRLDDRKVSIQWPAGHWSMRINEIDKFRFQKGDRVQWTESDDDIPEGHIGVVMGIKYEEDDNGKTSGKRVYVNWPNGRWSMKTHTLESLNFDTDGVNQLKLSFKRFDTNGDGKLSEEELVNVLGKIGGEGGAGLAPEECKQLFEALDKDGNGKLTVSEFIDYVFSDASGAAKVLLADGFGLDSALGFGEEEEERDYESDDDDPMSSMKGQPFDGPLQMKSSFSPDAAEGVDGETEVSRAEWATAMLQVGIPRKAALTCFEEVSKELDQNGEVLQLKHLAGELNGCGGTQGVEELKAPIGQVKNGHVEVIDLDVPSEEVEFERALAKRSGIDGLIFDLLYHKRSLGDAAQHLSDAMLSDLERKVLGEMSEQELVEGVLQGWESSQTLSAAGSWQRARECCQREVQQIIEKCKAEGIKYTDSSFNPLENENEVLYVDKEKPGWDCTVDKPTSWKRATEVFEDAYLVSKGASFSDVGQGAIGDCFFMGALSSMAQNRKNFLRQAVVAYDVEVGVYGVMVCEEMHFRYVIVDDYLGTHGSHRFMYGRSANDKRELWVPILEKAYFKHMTCLEMCDGGWGPEAVFSFLGGVWGYYNVSAQPHSTWETLDYGHRNGQIMTTGFTKPSKGQYANLEGGEDGQCGETGIGLGLVEGHCYSMLRTGEVENHKMICIRNPWAQKEWTGPWSDGSEQWTDEAKEKLGVKDKNDGTFWMEAVDFNQLSKRVRFGRTFGPTWQCAAQYGTFGKDPPFTCIAKHDYRAAEDDEISFKRGEKCKVTSNRGGTWLWGVHEASGKEGYFRKKDVDMKCEDTLKYELTFSNVPEDSQIIVGVFRQDEKKLRLWTKRKQDGMNYKDTEYSDAYLHVINKNGNQKKVKIRYYMRHGWEVLKASDGPFKIYVSCKATEYRRFALYAFAPSGELKWKQIDCNRDQWMSEVGARNTEDRIRERIYDNNNNTLNQYITLGAELLQDYPMVGQAIMSAAATIKDVVGSESLTDAAHKVKDFVNSEEVQNLSGQVKDLINSDEAQELVGQVGNMMSRASSWLTG